MSTSLPMNSSAADCGPGAALRGYVESLEGRLRGFTDSTGLEATLQGLSAGIDQVLVENAGMADELICLYEQIGVIFDVTRKLAEVQGEKEILSLFLTSLRRSFAPRCVYLAQMSGPSWRADDFASDSSGWLEAVLTKAVNRRGVAVEMPPAGTWDEPIAELMLGPIFSGDDPAAVLILARPADQTAFRSGEMLLLESLTTFCGDLIRNHRLVREVQSMSVAMVRSLVNAVDQKDEYTSGHSHRVACYAHMLGRRMQLGEAELQMLHWSALLHDVGKIGIRDSVLKKEGKLTDEEFTHIKEHPVRSYRVVQGIPQLAGALDGILYHHERYDGRGYPQGLSGEAIPLQARIIQIADVFDALTSTRSYRQAYSWQEALNIMDKEAGTALDPSLEPVFAGMIREQLVGKANGWQELTERAAAFTNTIGQEAKEVG